MKQAKEAGLVVHPFTFRAEPDRIAPYATSFENMLDVFYNTVKVDGVFTDYPDKAVKFLDKQ